MSNQLGSATWTLIFHWALSRPTCSLRFRKSSSETNKAIGGFVTCFFGDYLCGCWLVQWLHALFVFAVIRFDFQYLGFVEWFKWLFFLMWYCQRKRKAERRKCLFLGLFFFIFSILLLRGGCGFVWNMGKGGEKKGKLKNYPFSCLVWGMVQVVSRSCSKKSVTKEVSLGLWQCFYLSLLDFGCLAEV